MSCSEEEAYQFFCHDFEELKMRIPCAHFPYATEKQWADVNNEGVYEIQNLLVQEGLKNIGVNEKLFFVPKDIPVDLEMILESNLKPRFLEDEGLHVCRKPEVLRKMNYKMANRLIIEDKGKCWFGEDGCIIALPDPLLQFRSFRTDVPSPPLSCLASVFQKPVVVCEAKDSEKLWQLNLNLAALVFTNHPLFSQEHVLAQRLLELYEHYHTRKTQEKTSFLQDKLTALWSLQSYVNTDKVADNSKLRNLHHKILQTQKLIEAEMEAENSLVTKIVAVWKQIKELRARNGYVSTTIQLQLQRKKIPENLSTAVSASDKDDDPKSLKENVTQHYKCNELKELKKEEKSYSNNIPVTISQTRTEYTHLIPILYMNGIVTPDCNCPLEEQLRRVAVLQRRLSLKVFYNGKHVSNSEKKSFSCDFRIHIQQTISMQVVTSPENITLEVCEYVKNKSSVLARVHVPVPDRNMVSGSTPTEWSVFSSEKVVRSHYTGLGSDTASQENSMVNFITSGKLFYTMSWAVDESGLPLAPPVLPCKPRGFFSPMTSWPLLRDCDIQWIKGLEFDPNHPSNIVLNELLEESEQRLRAGGHFCLSAMEEEFQFATDEQLSASKRFSLLKLRSAQELEITPIGPIPLHEQQIPDDMLEEHSMRPTPFFLEEDCMSAQRARSIHYIQRVLHLRRKTFLITQKKYNLSDIVHEHQDAQTALDLNWDIFKPIRRLKPRRVQKRSVPCSTLSDGDLKIRVAINSATNLPVREHVYLLDRHTLGSYCGMSSSRNTWRYYLERGHLQNEVQPFAEVTFQGVTYETRTEQGSNPNWREEFIFDFISKDGDYSLSGLTKIEDVLTINIFDEVSFHMIESSSLKGCAERTYYGRQWLGSVALPFIALLQQSKVNCILRVDSPPTFLGYSWSKGCGLDGEDSHTKEQDNTSYLNVFITLEPPVHLKETAPVQDNQKPLWLFSTQEQDTLLDHANEFKRYCRRVCQGKRVITTVMSIVGEIVLANRFFRPVSPPQEFIQSDTNNVSLLRVARFVSLIPTIPGPSDVGDRGEIWLTSEQCLDLVVANSVSLAVLLSNFFLYLDIKAWVALGTSVTEGEVAYVLTEHNSDYKLWSPKDGRHYQPHDIFCPLKTVDCLINGQNIWLHKVQTTWLPKTFDPSNDETWTCMFSGDLASPSISVPSEIRYRPPQVELINQLQRRLQRRLKNSFVDWRSPHPTRWNSRCCSQLAAILPRLEHNVIASTIEPEIYTMLDSTNEYQVTGMPIQMAFTDVNQVIKVVWNTRIHSTESPATQFALAVHIESYPNDILSVWVFLATLVRRQEETLFHPHI